MGFHSALVDQARLLSKEPLGATVGGTIRFTDVRGEWFRCRLTLPGAPENLEGATYRRTVIRVPTLLYDIVDAVDEAVVLFVETRLEVNSKELGDQVWDVVSNPEPLRRKRRVMGWQTTLRRVEDYQFSEVVE